MTPMPIFGGELLTQILIHTSFLLTAGAYLVREILWLRALAILANLSVAGAVYRSGADANWIIIGWASAFVLINAGHSAWLLYERHLARLSEDERRLADTAFRSLDPVIVRRFAHICEHRLCRPPGCPPGSPVRRCRGRSRRPPRRARRRAPKGRRFYWRDRIPLGGNGNGHGGGDHDAALSRLASR